MKQPYPAESVPNPTNGNQSRKTYSEKLKDPRWQKKRLEILQRDEWACVICGATDKTLHVHHKAYERGLNPWEYANSWLVALCEDCHRDEPRIADYWLSHIVWILKSSLVSSDLRALCDVLALFAVRGIPSLRECGLTEEQYERLKSLWHRLEDLFVEVGAEIEGIKQAGGKCPTA